MFAQIFFLLLGVLLVVQGLKEGDYFGVLSGLVVASSVIAVFYQMKTGKNFWQTLCKSKA